MYPSKWLETFELTFASSLMTSKEKETFMSKLGEKRGLTFSVDTMNSELFTRKIENFADKVARSSFWVKLHSRGESVSIIDDFDRSTWVKIDSNNIDLMTYSMSINVEKAGGTKAYREVDKHSRKCNYPDEGDLMLFQHYTENNCYVECFWEKAEKTCGCRPWYVPALNGSRVCFVLETYCFESVLKNINKNESKYTLCPCPKDCEKTRYSITLEGLTDEERSQYGYPTDEPKSWRKDEGGIKTGNYYNLGNYLFDLKSQLVPEPSQLIRTTMPLRPPLGYFCTGWEQELEKTGDFSLLNYFCNHKVVDEALENYVDKRENSLITINMYFGSHQGYIPSITKDAKMSMGDKISWAGGNLGLLTGFSIVSVIEFLYWLIFKVLFTSPDENENRFH